MDDAKITYLKLAVVCILCIVLVSIIAYIIQTLGS